MPFLFAIIFAASQGNQHKNFFALLAKEKRMKRKTFCNFGNKAEVNQRRNFDDVTVNPLCCGIGVGVS